MEYTFIVLAAEWIISGLSHPPVDALLWAVFPFLDLLVEVLLAVLPLERDIVHELLLVVVAVLLPHLVVVLGSRPGDEGHPVPEGLDAAVSQVT